MEKTIKAKEFQHGFLTAEQRFPAFVAGWGTGKTYFGLLKAMENSLKYPNNLWLIVRKEFTDLRDSTMRDFERYFNIKIPSTKDVVLANGSVIMFRHGDELEILQNINLGGFLIEQAEEFETDAPFQMLRGRLRREGVPHFGAIIANTKGHNWIWKGWKKPDPARSKEYVLFEATTFDNRSNLPADFIADLESMKVESPSHYNRYVLNSWEDLDLEDKVIPYSAIQEAVNRCLRPLRIKKIVTCDPAEFGNDETVIYGLESGKIVKRDIFFKKEPWETVDRIFDIAYAMQAKNIVVDPIGVGSGIASFLRKRGEKEGIRILTADSRLKANDTKTYFNRRAEMWFAARARFMDATVCIPDDDDLLQEELGKIGYTMQSDNTRKIDPKEKIRKVDYLGHSPGRAEALVYGLWAEESIEYDDEVVGLEPEVEQTDMAESYVVESVL